MNSNIRVAPMVVGAGLDIDGDIVTINQLRISNPELAAYLLSKEGPEQLVALVDLINLAVSVKNLAGSSLETENVKKSAEMVVQSLNGTVASLLESIKFKTGQLMDPESGVIAQKMRETATSIGDNQETKLRDLLSPKKDGTPISDLQSTITTALTAHVNGLKTDITAVTQLLNEYIGSQKKGKELYANSREKGGDLETLLDSMIQLESGVHGDDARYVGDTPAPSGDSVGDELITLNKGVTNGEEVRIVWEAKTDKDFKDKKGRLKRDKVADELTAAIDNREAVCGIFVSDIAGLDMQVQPVWQEFEGNKLIIVLDPEDPDQRLVRMAYLWARSYALRALTPEEGEYDVEAIERVLNALKREFDGLTHLKRLHTPIRTNIKEAEEFVKTLEDNLEELLDELRDLMSPSEENVE
jgi:hypothetical protein